ncbi:MAG: hypothetical protein J5942_09635 [Prevotella sp.]|nr:hypothetical protein [Prevotella sp.]
MFWFLPLNGHLAERRKRHLSHLQKGKQTACSDDCPATVKGGCRWLMRAAPQPELI